ncbi:MAG: hypothetical protein CL608_21940 [Anaerolineaceae bacterium]|nr:hypothetical protein [Anaerolineaceae bacterium]
MTEEHAESQLFTIRVWLETDAGNQRQWRGKLRHVPSGEIRHFRGWAALIPLILDMLNRYTTTKTPDDHQAA